MIAILKIANLTLSFLLELCLLAAFGYWGFQTGTSLLLQIIMGIGVPLGVAVLWGVWMAPASARRLAVVPRLLLQIILFGLAMWALFCVGQSTLGLGLGITVIVNIALALLFGQEKLSKAVSL